MSHIDSFQEYLVADNLLVSFSMEKAISFALSSFLMTIIFPVGLRSLRLLPVYAMAVVLVQILFKLSLFRQPIRIQIC